MAKAATKTTAPKKRAAPKAAAAPTAAATPKPADSIGKTEAAPAKDTATIKFDKTHHGGRVRGAVNGQKFDLPVGVDVQVTAAQLEALQASDAKFEIVTPLAGEDADEGSSASSTLTGTATRLEPAAQATAPDGELKDPPELKQTTDEELLKGGQQANAEQAAKAEADAK